MRTLSSSFLLHSFIDTLTADKNCAPLTGAFTCRPLKGVTGEQDTVVGRFCGDITFAQTKEFQQALDELVTDKTLKVILDFEGVSLSRTAIGNLVFFAAMVFGRNKRLYIYRASVKLKESLTALGLLSFFTFIETEDDILATLVV